MAPHVDEPEFAVNVLLMLDRSSTDGEGSATVLAIGFVRPGHSPSTA